MWLATLESEERDRVDSLRASIDAVAAAEMPTPDRVNALLVSALQAEVTLMRMSRVFPDAAATKRTDVAKALGHPPTAALAYELHRAWKALGVSDPTVAVLLRQVMRTVGEQTRSARVKFFVHLLPKLQRGVDPNAHKSFAAEGPGQWFLAYRQE